MVGLWSPRLCLKFSSYWKGLRKEECGGQGFRQRYMSGAEFEKKCYYWCIVGRYFFHAHPEGILRKTSKDSESETE